MRIAKLYPVSFTGKMSTLQAPAHTDFWIERDDGTRFEVHVPNHPKVLEAFEWLNDNDCLRHLQHVGPSYTTNVAEVERAEYQNAMAQETAYTMGKYSKGFDPITGQMTSYPYFNSIPVPTRMFTVVWSFWSKQHAVMFKLACGGSLED